MKIAMDQLKDWSQPRDRNGNLPLSYPVPRYKVPRAVPPTLSAGDAAQLRQYRSKIIRLRKLRKLAPETRAERELMRGVAMIQRGSTTIPQSLQGSGVTSPGFVVTPFGE